MDWPIIVPAFERLDVLIFFLWTFLPVVIMINVPILVYIAPKMAARDVIVFKLFDLLLGI